MSVFSLCPCSIFGAIRTGSYMMYILMTKGLKQSVCDQSFYNGPVSKFWAYAFVLSKAPELGKSKPSSCIRISYYNVHCYHNVYKLGTPLKSIITERNIILLLLFSDAMQSNNVLTIQVSVDEEYKRIALLSNASNIKCYRFNQILINEQ